MTRVTFEPLSRKVDGTIAIPLIWLLLLTASGQAQQGSLAGVKIPSECINFLGNRSFSSEDLRAIFRSAGTVTAQLPPESMDTYNNDRLVHASNMLLAFYRNRGFVKAVIHPAELDLNSARPGTMTLLLRITENNPY